MIRWLYIMEKKISLAVGISEIYDCRLFMDRENAESLYKKQHFKQKYLKIYAQ